jgi:DNA repair exonuclease SbcCD ATPase subunit
MRKRREHRCSGSESLLHRDEHKYVTLGSRLRNQEQLMSKKSSAPNSTGGKVSSALTEARKRVKTAKQRVKLIKIQLKEARAAVKAAKTARAQVEAAQQKPAKPSMTPRKSTSATSAKKGVNAKPGKRRVKRAPTVISAQPAEAAFDTGSISIDEGGSDVRTRSKAQSGA